MKPYIPNNINFRTVSSNSIAKFKQDQAYDFFEIVKLGDKISDAAKEVILLEYDTWFKWILKLEKLFLLLDEQDTDAIIFERVELLFKTEMDDIFEIMTVQSNFFKPNLTKFVGFIHKYSSETLLKVIKSAIIDNDLGCGFSKIVFYISIYLQQLLLAMQEIEAMSMSDRTKPADLYYSGWCKEICVNGGGVCSGVCPVAERAKYYHSLNNRNEFVLHNITSEILKQDCINKVNQYNIKIIEVKNRNMVS